MTRAEMLAHAASTLPELAAVCGVSLVDAPAGIAGQLDAAARDLGADTGNAAAGEALIEYHVLRRCRFALAARMDYQATAVERNRSQIFGQVNSLLTDAAARAAAAGHPVTTGAESASLLRLNLDWIEPDVWSAL